MLLVAWAAACTATPVPEPPGPQQPDFRGIGGPEIFPQTDQIEVRGDDGTVGPNQLVRVTNLDTTDPPVDVVADANGGFTVGVPGEQGDELRLQTIVDGERSEPLDVLFDGLPSRGQREDCVTLTPPTFRDLADAGPSTTIALRNDCGQDVTVDSVVIRRSAAQLQLNGDPTTGVLTDGGERAIDLDVGTGSFEDVVLITVALQDGSTIRYPVTLYVD